jgi:DNA-binding transcriptional regulator YiaG
MAKGVSGALTRLAKVKGASPLGSGAGSGRPSRRSGAGDGAGDGDEDDAYYLPEDLEELSASHFLKRRAEARVEPVPPAPAPAPVPAARPDPAPVYVDTGRHRGGGSRLESRVGSFDDEEPEEDVPAPGDGRSEGRVAQRIRRIKTALAVRVGQDPASSAAGRRGGAGKASRATGAEPEDDDSDEPGHALRGSFRPKQLARARRRLGMTQAEFARCFGLNTDDVVRWEAGGRPSQAERVLLTLIMHDPEETARLVDEAMPLK